jgi:hypothetical protein
MSNRPRYATMLRRDLCARNASYAASEQMPYVTSNGEAPVVVYQASPCGKNHGNFISASYQALTRRPEWKERLAKVHSSAGRALPKSDRIWKELDSSMSSDALLMNIFCYPGVTKRKEFNSILGTETGDVPEFGFRPRIPLTSGSIERTEIDMKLGSVLFEAKLTEADFQIQNAAIVEGYSDLEEVFEVGELPRRGRKYVSYQLLRNVLAAHALDLAFCLLIDVRRPDLVEDWYEILRCIRTSERRGRCKVLTWQGLAPFLPQRLRKFLDLKYGIASAAVAAPQQRAMQSTTMSLTFP